MNEKNGLNDDKQLDDKQLDDKQLDDKQKKSVHLIRTQ